MQSDSTFPVMGAIFTKSEPPQDGTLFPGEIPLENGYIFNEYYLPPEVVEHILGFLDPILHGRLVCKAWREIIDSPSLWREKILREVPGATPCLFHKELKREDYHCLWSGKPHKKNLILNGSAEDEFKNWTVSARGHRWKIEKTPIGCDPFPPGIKSCFVTSYDWCSAEQVINLQNFGLTPSFMKHVKPKIIVEEWYAGRFDCGFHYSLKVTLLSRAWEIVQSRFYEDEAHTTAWKKVQLCFDDYDQEVNLIVFEHKGKDNQFWAGHYGVKMSGAKVYVTLPGWEEMNENEN